MCCCYPVKSDNNKLISPHLWHLPGKYNRFTIVIQIHYYSGIYQIPLAHLAASPLSHQFYRPMHWGGEGTDKSFMKLNFRLCDGLLWTQSISAKDGLTVEWLLKPSHVKESEKVWWQRATKPQKEVVMLESGVNLFTHSELITVSHNFLQQLFSYNH